MINILLSLTVVTILFASSSAFAAGIQRFDCQTKNACQHASPDKLGVCVSEVELYIHSDRTGLLVARTQKINSNRSKAISYQVAVNGNSESITCRDGVGDNWAQIRAIANGVYRGSVTLEQDFQFNIDCRLDISVPFRR